MGMDSVAVRQQRTAVTALSELIRLHAPAARHGLVLGPLHPTVPGLVFDKITGPFDFCRRLPFPDGSFPVILIARPGDLYDPFAAASEIHRVLGAGGLLVVSTPSGPQDFFEITDAGLKQMFPALRELSHSDGLWAAVKPIIRSSGGRLTSLRFNSRLFEFNMQDIQAVYDAVLDAPAVRPVIGEVLHWKDQDISADLLSDGERSFPAEKRFFDTGYWRMMVGRYLFAGSQLCSGAEVLDSCCGLGWGARIISHFARHVTAFDRDAAAIAFCRKTWQVHNTEWATADALDLGTLAARQFDVALGMETIEHFTVDDGERYIKQIERALCRGGVFAGTSAFPAEAAQARRMESENPHHLHIYTRDEILALLLQYFSRAAIIGDWMLLALK